MIKVTLKINNKELQKLRKRFEDLPSKALDKATAEVAGTLAVKEMKRQIAAGISPIKGSRRFPAYKNPNRYPGNRKPKTPVNLYLTGAMISNLRHEIIKLGKGFGFSIGYRGTDAQQKEIGHAIGWNGQPKRPTIPQPGQSFSAEIERIIVETYDKRLKDYLQGK